MQIEYLRRSAWNKNRLYNRNVHVLNEPPNSAVAWSIVYLRFL